MATASAPRLLMAQMRSADRVGKCLLLRLDRTYRAHHETDAFDPSRTQGDARIESVERCKADIDQPALTDLDL